MKKILVLGSNSFAGSCFINFILKKKFKVIGVSRSNEKNKYECIYFKNKNLKNFKFIKADINKNLDKIKSTITKRKINYIVDFLGQGMVAESWINPEQWFQTNIISKINLINFLVKKKIIKKYIRISTPEVYGSSSKKLTENSIQNPSTPYAITHMTIDKYLKLMNTQYSFPVNILRFANFYGKSQPLYRIIPKTIITILKKNQLPLHGNGSSLRSFIHINDFCNAIYLGLMKGKNGETYNFSSSEIISIKNLIKKISKKMQYNYSKLVKIKKDRPGKDYKYFMSSKKANNQLNWINLISLDKGIDDTIQWYKENFKYLKNKSLNYNHKK